MEVKIEELASFKLIGITRSIKNECVPLAIPQFWNEHLESEQAIQVNGKYGLCHGFSEDKLLYTIADDLKNQKNIGMFEIVEIPKATWAKFPCRGPMPDAMNDTFNMIHNKWIPGSIYEISAPFEIEYYPSSNTQDSDYYSEIWVPISVK